jgi:hypothetical protein
MVVATGIAAASANSAISFQAPESSTPPPAIITGFLAFKIALIAFLTKEQSGQIL